MHRNEDRNHFLQQIRSYYTLAVYLQLKGDIQKYTSDLIEDTFQRGFLCCYKKQKKHSLKMVVTDRQGLERIFYTSLSSNTDNLNFNNINRLRSSYYIV